MKPRLLVGNEAGDKLSIDAVSLAALANAFCIVKHVLGVEHIHNEAQLVGQLSKQLVIGAGGLHADAAACWKALEPCQQCATVVSDLTRGEALLGAGHDDFVLGDVGADVDVSQCTQLDHG